jgi:hypothetical protein
MYFQELNTMQVYNLFYICNLLDINMSRLTNEQIK